MFALFTEITAIETQGYQRKNNNCIEFSTKYVLRIQLARIHPNCTKNLPFSCHSQTFTQRYSIIFSRFSELTLEFCRRVVATRL